MPYEAWAGSETGPTHPLLSKPVIAAVAGYACAGGLGLALWCDLRVAEEGAVFAMFSRRWGVPHSDGTTVRLPRLIGMSRALDIMLTGRAVEAKEAYEIGLANRLVLMARHVKQRSSWHAKSPDFRRSVCDLTGDRHILRAGCPSGKQFELNQNVRWRLAS